MYVCVYVCIYRQTAVYMLVLEHARVLDELITDVKVLGQDIKSRRA